MPACALVLCIALHVCGGRHSHDGQQQRLSLLASAAFRAVSQSEHSVNALGASHTPHKPAYACDASDDLSLVELVLIGAGQAPRSSMVRLADSGTQTHA